MLRASLPLMNGAPGLCSGIAKSLGEYLNPPRGCLIQTASSSYAWGMPNEFKFHLCEDSEDGCNGL